MKDIETLLELCSPDLREIVFHTDGRVITKTGGRAKHPKKLYTGRHGSLIEKTAEALTRLYNENN
jgi:ketosteroid isomerase-like protein